jgi:hypothetical protein
MGGRTGRVLRTTPRCVNCALLLFPGVVLWWQRLLLSSLMARQTNGTRASLPPPTAHQVDGKCIAAVLPGPDGEGLLLHLIQPARAHKAHHLQARAQLVSPRNRSASKTQPIPPPVKGRGGERVVGASMHTSRVRACCGGRRAHLEGAGITTGLPGAMAQRAGQGRQLPARHAVGRCLPVARRARAERAPCSSNWDERRARCRLQGSTRGVSE